MLSCHLTSTKKGNKNHCFFLWLGLQCEQCCSHDYMSCAVQWERYLGVGCVSLALHTLRCTDSSSAIDCLLNDGLLNKKAIYIEICVSIYKCIIIYYTNSQRTTPSYLMYCISNNIGWVGKGVVIGDVHSAASCGPRHTVISSLHLTFSTVFTKWRMLERMTLTLVAMTS